MKVFHSHNIKVLLVEARTIVAVALICLAAAMASCRSIKTVTVEVPVPVHDTTYVSTAVHDSVWLESTTVEYIKGDTVYKTKIQFKYVERLKVDTVIQYIEKPVEITKETTEYVEKDLAWWEVTLMFIGGCFLFIIIMYIIYRIVKLKTKLP